MNIDPDIPTVDDFNSWDATLHLENNILTFADDDRLELGINFEMSAFAVLKVDSSHHFDLSWTKFNSLVLEVHDSAHLTWYFFFWLFSRRCGDLFFFN